MRKYLVMVLLALACLSGRGQVAATTFTATDSDGQTWNNGTYTITLISTATGLPVPYGNAFRTDTGATIQVSYPQANLSGSGAASISLTEVSYIKPGGVTWQFVVCPAVSNPICGTVNIPVNASGDVSTYINGAITAPRIGGGIGSFAYADVEVAAIANNSYYNTTSSACRYHGVSWGSCDSGGSSGFPIVLGSTSISSGSTTTSVSGLTVDGVSPTTMGYVDVTSSIQTQLNSKSPTASPTFTGIVTTPALTLSGGSFTGTTCLEQVSGVVTPTGSACGSGGNTFQVNGTGLISSTTINFENSSATNGLTLTFTNPSTGNVQLGFTGTLTNAGLANSATTVNSQTCTLGSTCTIPFQTNTVSNTSQAGVNFTTSTTNSVGLTVTPVNSATNVEKFEITGGSYTGTAAGLTSCTTSAAGSLCYWNGTSWQVLAGNASGTAALQETSSGVPSWVAAVSGTVTSIVTTSPITGGTITSTGTIACGTCIVATTPAAGVATFAGSTQTIGSEAQVTAAQGGTGVSNTATLTLGTSNRNYATLGTGFEYNTTTTGAVTDATAAQLGALINVAQYDLLVSGGTAAAVAGIAPSATSGAILASAGSAANPAYDANATVSAGTLSLGASGTLGDVVMGNATSGTITLEPTTGAITSYTIGLPVAQPSGSNTYLSCTAANPAVCTWAAAGLPTTTAGQTYYSNSTTGSATSAILVGATSGAITGSGLGVGGLEFSAAPVFFDSYAPTGAVTFNGSCASGTTTSCNVNNGSSLLDPNGGVIFAGVGDGSNDGEFIKYGSASTTAITTLTRGYWGSAAATHGNSVPLQLVTHAWDTSTSTFPYGVVLQDGTLIWGFGGSSTWTNNLPAAAGGQIVTNDNIFAGGLSLTFTGNNKGFLDLSSNGLATGSWGTTNTDANFTNVTCGTALCYNIATQTIATTSTLTALTNVLTPTFPTNGTTAAAGAGGVLSSRCHVIWSQATGGTISFAVHLSAAVTRLDVTEVDYDGSAGIVGSSYVQQGVTASGTGSAIGTVTPSGFGTVYFSDFTLTMNPGTTNNAAVQLYAESSSSSDTLSVYAGSGCESWK